MLPPLGQLLPKQFMRLAQSTALAEWGAIKIVRFDAQAGGDGVAEEVEPGELVGGECPCAGRPHLRRGFGEVGVCRGPSDGFLVLLEHPNLVAFPHRVRGGFEHEWLFQREADGRGAFADGRRRRPVDPGAGPAAKGEAVS